MARLELVIEADADAPAGGGQLHVRGTVRTGDGPETGFVGWVGLLALLEQALTVPAAS